MSYPNNYRYTKEHEWAELLNDTQIRVGITDHAQSALGDIVYLDLPKVGRTLNAHEVFGVVESIKAVSDLYSPVQGTVSSSHEALIQEPGKINSDPHGQWMLVLDCPNAKAQFDGLMSAADYEGFVKTL